MSLNDFQHISLPEHLTFGIPPGMVDNLVDPDKYSRAASKYEEPGLAERENAFYALDLAAL